jgi:predicted DNA-binding transcriptional regulator AlpA
MDEDIKESFSDSINECNTEIEDIEYIRMCQAVKKYDITRQTLYNWIKE